MQTHNISCLFIVLPVLAQGLHKEVAEEGSARAMPVLLVLQCGVHQLIRDSQTNTQIVPLRFDTDVTWIIIIS